METATEGVSIGILVPGEVMTSLGWVNVTGREDVILGPVVIGEAEVVYQVEVQGRVVETGEEEE